MVGAIGASGITRGIDMQRAETQAGTAPRAPAPARTAEARPSLVADLASGGAPVDTDKVARLRAAIVEGRYQIDPRAIADRMIDADLPPA